MWHYVVLGKGGGGGGVGGGGGGELALHFKLVHTFRPASHASYMKSLTFLFHFLYIFFVGVVPLFSCIPVSPLCEQSQS